MNNDDGPAVPPAMSGEYSVLRPWRLSHLLTATRTVGEIGFNKNGSQVDIWVRIGGRPRWFSVHRPDLRAFLSGNKGSTVMSADSDGNDEALAATDDEAPGSPPGYGPLEVAQRFLKRARTAMDQQDWVEANDCLVKAKACTMVTISNFVGPRLSGGQISPPSEVQP